MTTQHITADRIPRNYSNIGFTIAPVSDLWPALDLVYAKLMDSEILPVQYDAKLADAFNAIGIPTCLLVAPTHRSKQMKFKNQLKRLQIVLRARQLKYRASGLVSYQTAVMTPVKSLATTFEPIIEWWNAPLPTGTTEEIFHRSRVLTYNPKTMPPACFLAAANSILCRRVRSIQIDAAWIRLRCLYPNLEPWKWSQTIYDANPDLKNMFHECMVTVWDKGTDSVRYNCPVHCHAHNEWKSMPVIATELLTVACNFHQLKSDINAERLHSATCLVSQHMPYIPRRRELEDRVATPLDAV